MIAAGWPSCALGSTWSPCGLLRRGHGRNARFVATFDFDTLNEPVDLAGRLARDDWNSWHATQSA
jgi:hypothetical protein